MPMKAWPDIDCAGRCLSLAVPRVMGILNVTPDSFSDGGRYQSVEAAVDHGRQMVADGAAIIDVGGESTRPGAIAVAAEQECERVVPVIEALAREVEVPLSVDTSKPEVMRAAVTAGAGLINDVRALAQPGALATAAALQVPVCLMHMQGEPTTMQDAPAYGDVVADVLAYLTARCAACEAAGIERRLLFVDPGFGFGKTLLHNLRLLKQLERLQALGRPLLIGVSRKSMLGQILEAPVDARQSGGVAAAVIAVLKGASLIRTHDVQATVEALRVVMAIEQVDNETINDG